MVLNATLLNTTGFIGQTVEALTTNVTGSAALSFFVIIMLVFALVLGLRIPIEYGALLVMPLLLVMAVTYGAVMLVVVLVLLFVALLLAKLFFFNA